jgi:deazaflavin-dependent oxidoreductase (nitroreductase family)
VPLEPGLARRSLCYLETIGQVTGNPREIEIWFAADPDRDRVYLLSGGRDEAHWVRNLVRNPDVRVRIGSRTVTGQAEVIEGGPDEATARRLVAGKYGEWTEAGGLSRWARESLPVAIDLVLASPEPSGDAPNVVPAPIP